jgi:RNA polymerase sigma-70 factor (ECF subfamily)
LIYESNRVLQITTPFKDKVFRLAKRLLISKEAEDATQEVLSKLWSKNDSPSIWAVEAFAMTMTKIIVWIN